MAEFASTTHYADASAADVYGYELDGEETALEGAAEQFPWYRTGGKQEDAEAGWAAGAAGEATGGKDGEGTGGRGGKGGDSGGKEDSGDKGDRG